MGGEQSPSSQAMLELYFILGMANTPVTSSTRDTGLDREPASRGRAWGAASAFQGGFPPGFLVDLRVPIQLVR